MPYVFTPAETPAHRRRAPVPVIDLGSSLDCDRYHFGALEVAPAPRPVSDWQPLPHQEPPAGEDWSTWLVVAGRGSGKTMGAAQYVLQHLRELGPKARVGIGAPSLGDVRDVCAEGETGLITLAPDEFPLYHRSIGYCEARHIDGGYVRFQGSEEPKRWNGKQWSLLWWDEWALINAASYQESQFGLRLGRWPRQIITTTPKRPTIRQLRALIARPGVVTRYATTDDNVYLSERRKAELRRDYGGTTTGRMELGGELIEDVEGALWKQAWIDDARRPAASESVRVVLGIDPNGGSSNPNTADTGLCVATKTAGGDYEVLALEGVHLSPLGWANRAIWLYDHYQCDRIVCERNYGGQYVEQTLRGIRPELPITMVSATRGKEVRAEPIASLYEQGRVHHVGVFGAGEDQLCSFPVSAEKKDMVDALVWCLSDLSQAPAAGSFVAADTALAAAETRRRDSRDEPDRRGRPLVSTRW